MLWLAGFDVLAWVGAYLVVGAVHELLVPRADVSIVRLVTAGLVSGVLFVLIGVLVRLHQGRAPLGSFDDALLITIDTVAIATLINVVNLAGGYFNRAVGVFTPLLALLVMLGARGFYRLLMQQLRTSDGDREPVIIVGAGDAGRQLAVSMLSDPTSRWRPAAFIDDDPLKRHRRLRGIAVLGRTDEIREVAEQVDAKTLVIAIPSAGSEAVRRISARSTEAGLDVKVLPSAADLLVPSKVGISDIRDIDVTDLLGRHQIETDVSAIASYLTGKRVLVTGAGGSIGSELCRQIAKFGPSELIMLDRDESALHAVQLSIYGKAMLDGDDTVLADIRDTEFIHDLFQVRQPQVVFHAAALKHLPLLEKAPGEAIKTNVWGSLTVLEAAAHSGVEKFVNISTDKAANPTSVLGYSKRLAEGLTAAVARETDGTFLSVRFGNVLGSRGSVLTAFAKQIADGGPVTVTDPQVTRYFMTIQEAVQLVIQAGAIGSDGEVLVLDMGDPVSIDAVARQLIDISGERIEVVYTGLRDGEKMHEELFGDGEVDERPRHPLVSHTPVPDFAPLDARGMDAWANRMDIIESMQRQCDLMAVRASDEVFSA